MPALRRTCTALVTTAVLALLGAGALAQPASAAPPVTVDDHVSMYPGASRAVDVVANDSDADGNDDLSVCRVAGAGEHRHYFVGIEEGRLYVLLGPRATGEITITYYACDFETLTPGTLRISVKKVVPIRVTKLDRPGLLRVTNRNDARVRFMWGSFAEDRPDARVVVGAHDAVVIRVHRHRIDWVAALGRGNVLRIGHVRNIDLPRNDHLRALRVPAPDGRDARAWAAAGR
jgi:hypothetical protein